MKPKTNGPRTWWECPEWGYRQDHIQPVVIPAKPPKDLK